MLKAMEIMYIPRKINPIQRYWYLLQNPEEKPEIIYFKLEVFVQHYTYNDCYIIIFIATSVH